MCGISVLYNKDKIQPSEYVEFKNSLQIINHRGPDDGGIVLINTITGNYRIYHSQIENFDLPTSDDVQNYNLALGHKRLSIIDLSAGGHQPMQGIDGSWIVFNGEIYNYLELRDELRRLGSIFKTNSDTEVILESYRVWGKECLSKFNGMFSFVIYNIKEKNIFIANDRYGVKPLYFASDNKKLIFISEIKQIKAYSINISFNTKIFNEFLNTAYLDYDNRTVYNELYRFNSSHYSVINLHKFNGKFQQTPYYIIKFSRRTIKIEEAIEEFNALFNSAIAVRMRSDVVVGCSLSGGLDSSSILVRAIKNLHEVSPNSKLSTFSIVFPGQTGDESEFINLLTTELNVTSYLLNALDEFSIPDFEKHIYHQDFPIQSTSYYAEWCLAKKVREENVTVVLNGQGGDELLAGYHHHFYRYCRQLVLSGQVLKYLSLSNKYAQLKNITISNLHQFVFNDLKLVAKYKMGLAKLSTSLENKWNKPNKLIELLKLDFTEYMLPTYLRSDDRDFMASCVETRHPFLDYRLVDFCNSLPDDLKIRDGWQKWLLRMAINELPEEIKFRKDKKGYTTPQIEWMKLYKLDFEEYLNYLPSEFKNISGNNKFLKYSLGAWYKINKLN